MSQVSISLFFFLFFFSIKCFRIAWDFSTLLHLKQGQASQLIFENDAIRNRVSNDFDKRSFVNKMRNKSTSHELQNNLW